MNTKTKKGKAIIGIAMAAIMIASVFAVMVPSYALSIGAPSSDEGNFNLVGEGKGEIGDNPDVTYPIVIGEKLKFVGDCTGKTIIGKSDDVEDQPFGQASDSYDTTALRAANTYYVDINPNAAYDPGTDVLLSAQEMIFAVNVKDTEGETISSTTETERIYLKPTGTTSLFDDDLVKIKAENPDGNVQTLKTDVKLGESHLEANWIDTTGWTTGEWTLWLATQKDDARGLDKSSDKKTVTIFKEEITIAAANEEPVVGEDVKITVKAPPYDEFTFKVETDAENVIVTSLEDNPFGLAPGVEDSMDNSDDHGAWASGEFEAETDEDGEYIFVVNFNDDRGFTLEVKRLDDPDDDDDIEIDVQKATVTFDVATTVLIGEDLTIKGTISEGNEVTIYVDDDLIDTVSATDGEFKKDWATKGEKEGSVRIDVYIDLEDKIGGAAPDDKDDIQAGIDEDGTTTVRLIEPGLSAEQPRAIIAEEDDYVVEGSATGVGDVDIVIIGPDGYDGGGYTLENGLLFETSNVDKDNLFEEEVDTTDAETGRYIVLVFGPGRDGDYGSGDREDGDLEGWLRTDCKYTFDGKSKSQILDMVIDATTEDTASDDLIVPLEFMIESPYVTLDAIADVGQGEPLNVTGITNREDGTVIMVTLTGPSSISATTEVEDGKFSATVDTSELSTGAYVIEADDGDGHIATGSVNIGEEPTPTPTPTPTATVSPTPTATVPTTPTPTATATEPTAEPTEPTPGFGALFAITGLLAVAYLVLRIKK
ncbi:hypothetical protein C5S30_05930 [ANME-1 cluster archaeon GoMg4]|nr:hypothetical protein [ANME-1 cluster archaeon GoMg4]